MKLGYLGFLLCCLCGVNAVAQELRAPAVPLVTCDPYFSIWSPSNKLAESNTTHWTGREHRLLGTITVDGTSYRLIGKDPSNLVAMEQKRVEIFPTRTIADFESSEIALRVIFTTPALPESIDLLSWPITYVTFEIVSRDGKKHDVSLRFEAGGEVAVNEASNQKVVWSQPSIDGLVTVSAGSESQQVLNRSGDDLRIDWGYLYLSAHSSQQPSLDGNAIKLTMPNVGTSAQSKWLIIAYDDLYSIQYMGKDLRPFWRRNGWEAADLLKSAAEQYASLTKRCAAFDEELITDLRRCGGEDYAQLCSLCFRQCFAAGKFVADKNGQPLQFCKENHSNGCIATSDVFYPMAPQFLLFGPSLTKSFLVPFMDYAASNRWKFPFAPHDLGQYPLANGQVYGGGERTEDNQMPVEESGNLLLLLAATAQMEGNPEFANRYWKQVEQWANYLIKEGFDPANQLCTDDFAGHLAHNVNLSVKAICAIGAYGKLCEMRGDQSESTRAMKIAREYAQRWVAAADSGDHYRLAFDQKESWSQKYNLVWDQILGLNLFPAEVAEKEMAWYRKVQNKFGLPLDNRETYTKLDWILWTATLTGKKEDFDALVKPVMQFINETPDRSPLTDWYQTKSAKKVGFTARSVVGGVFLKTLYDKKLWTKWAGRETFKAANWASIPKAPVITEVVPTAMKRPTEWSYTDKTPASDWMAKNFVASGWKKGVSGFGTEGTPGAVIGTNWNTSDIWLIRDLEVDSKDLATLNWFIHHDEDVKIYVNGELAESFTGYTTQYVARKFSASTKKLLTSGKNRIAVHCHQTGGGQYIDLGLINIEQRE